MLNLNNESKNISNIQINDRTYKIIFSLENGDSPTTVKSIISAVATTLSSKKIFVDESVNSKKLYTPFMLLNSEEKINLLTEMCKLNGISVKIVKLSDRELLAKI